MIVGDGFMLREIGADKYIVAVGAQAREFHAVVRVNISASIVFSGFKSGKSADEIAAKLTGLFKVDMDRALADVANCARKFVEIGVMSD